MKKLQASVYMFQATKASHAYFLMLPGHNVIIDTGFPKKSKQMLKELDNLGIKPDAITDILITHNDIDHIGSAFFLQQTTGAKLWMHAKDLANMRTHERPFIKRLLGFFIRTKLPNVNGIIDSTTEVIPGITAIETPGHTPGHTIYLWKDVVFSGDAVSVSKDGQLKLPPSFINADQQASAKSLRHIQQIPYKLLCPAHGVPISKA